MRLPGGRRVPKFAVRTRNFVILLRLCEYRYDRDQLCYDRSDIHHDRKESSHDRGIADHDRGIALRLEGLRFVWHVLVVVSCPKYDPRR